MTVDEQREPERIEIELTSHEPTRGPRSTHRIRNGDGDGSVVATVGERPVGLLETERGRLIATSALIGVVALLVGVLLGRAGSEGDVATADRAATSTTVRARTSTTVSSDSEVFPPVPPVVTPPPTTRLEVTVAPVEVMEETEERDAPVTGVIELDSEFVDLGVEIVGLTRGNEVIRIDPATGNTVTYPAVNGFGSSGVYAGPGWILMPGVSFRGEPGAVVLTDDGTMSVIETGGSWPFRFSEDGSGRFWLLYDQAGGVRMVEMSLSGEPTGSELDLTIYPRLIDPLGGFVVDAPGGSYRVTSEGATQMSPGRVLAAGRGTLFVEECDEVLACEHLLVDRETGDRRSVDVAPGVRDGLNNDVLGQRLTGNMFNDAEDRLLLGFWSPVNQRELVGVLDLDAGAFTEFAGVDAYQATTMRWVPDGRSILWLDATSRLSVIDLATGESRRFSEDLVPLTGFAVRPLSSAADG